MTPLKHFLVFGICVAAVVVLAQSALGATRPAAAKPAARVSSFEPARHHAMVVSPARMRVQTAPLVLRRGPGSSSAFVPRRGPGSSSALVLRRGPGSSSVLDRRRVAGFSAQAAR